MGLFKLYRNVNISYKDGMIVVSSKAKWTPPFEANFTYGEPLREMLNRHKVVHKEIEERNPDGSFKRYVYEVGG